VKSTNLEEEIMRLQIRLFLSIVLTAGISATILSGCETYSPRSAPYVDRYATNPGDQETFCRQQAQNAYDRAVDHNTRVLASYSVGGTAAGAGIGSLSRSRAGKGALIGLGVGALVGMTQTQNPQREADLAWNQCMNRRYIPAQ
jgi:hypothetical protein